MKKRIFSLLMALCLMLTLVPAVFAADTSGLQTLIDNTPAGGSINLTENYNITEKVTINKALTINGGGHSITYNGSGAAIEVTATGAVALNNLTVNATASGGRGIAVNTQQMNLTLTGCTLNVHSRGINIFAEDANHSDVGRDVAGSLTLDNTKILNSQVSDYVNNTTVGDTRGVSVYRVKGGTITVKNNSEIKGFGYSINSAGYANEDGVCYGGNTYDIQDSQIWGWSAFNVWTVSNTFNITNSVLRGINRLDSDWNTFATFVINNGIYKGMAKYANKVNITGGNVQAYAFGTAGHTDFLESSESITQFTFSKYNNTPVYLIYPAGSTAFAVSAPGTSANITGAGNVVQLPVSSS